MPLVASSKTENGDSRMVCVDCSVETVVYRTVSSPTLITRVRHCPVCRARYLTRETVARRISDCNPNVKRMAREEQALLKHATYGAPEAT